MIGQARSFDSLDCMFGHGWPGQKHSQDRLGLGLVFLLAAPVVHPQLGDLGVRKMGELLAELIEGLRKVGKGSYDLLPHHGKHLRQHPRPSHLGKNVLCTPIHNLEL